MITFSQVDKALSNGGPLFVRNNSRHAASGACSILVVNYPSAEGTTAFNIPRVTIPFNICDHVDPESLRSSRAFRKLINTGVLEVVDEKIAITELKDPQAQETFRSALREADNQSIYTVRRDEAQASKDAEQAIKTEKAAEQSHGMKHMLASMDPRLAAALDASALNSSKGPQLEDSRNPRFTSLEARSKGMAPSQVVSELKLMYGDLTLNDLQAVATGHAWPLEAQKWARERLAYAIAATNEQAALPEEATQE